MITKISPLLLSVKSQTHEKVNKNKSNVSTPDSCQLRHKLGVKILSNQISFGINKKNIKNYTEDEVEFLQFRQNFSSKLHKRSVNYAKARWDFFINSSEENRKKLEKAQIDYGKLFQNEKTMRFLQNLAEKDIKDPLLVRQLKNLTESFENQCGSKKVQIEPKQMEIVISKKFNSYEPEINGKKTTVSELKKILESSKDENLRKQAYEALVKRGDEIAMDMAKLVRKRNSFAKSKGYKNYFEYKLQKTYKVDTNKVSQLFDELSLAAQDVDSSSRKEKDAKLKKIFRTDHLEPWHYSLQLNSNPYKKADKYIKNRKILVDTSKQIYKDMGWDIDNLPISYDLFPKKNKNGHAFSFNIDTNKDIRILANLKNDTNGMKDLCHELGHSVYSLGISERIPYAEKTFASMAMTEAVAEMMEDIYIKENVLQDKLGIPEELSDELKSYSKRIKAAFVQKVVFYFNFEKALYENPNQDLPKLWYSLKQKYMKLNPPEEMHNEWCTVPHFLTHPAYYQNYLRADIMAEQIYESATKKLGPLTKNKKTASYLQKLFKTGSLYDENETLKRFTGSELNVEAYKKIFDN